MSFTLNKDMIDLIKSSVPDNVAINESLVRPFITSTKRDLRSAVSRKEKEIRSQCPCHQAVDCPLCINCGCCNNYKSGISNVIEPKPAQFDYQDIDMDLISHPDTKVFEVLFTTNGGIVPSIVLHLNELNLWLVYMP